MSGPRPALTILPVSKAGTAQDQVSIIGSRLERRPFFILDDMKQLPVETLVLMWRSGSPRDASLLASLLIVPFALFLSGCECELGNAGAALDGSREAVRSELVKECGYNGVKIIRETVDLQHIPRPDGVRVATYSIQYLFSVPDVGEIEVITWVSCGRVQEIFGVNC